MENPLVLMEFSQAIALEWNWCWLFGQTYTYVQKCMQ